MSYYTSPPDYENNTLPFVEPLLSEMASLAETAGVKVTYDEDFLEFETDVFYLYLPDYREAGRFTSLNFGELNFAIHYSGMVIMISTGQFSVASRYADINYPPREPDND